MKCSYCWHTTFCSTSIKTCFLCRVQHVCESNMHWRKLKDKTWIEKSSHDVGGNKRKICERKLWRQRVRKTCKKTLLNTSSTRMNFHKGVLIRFLINLTKQICLVFILDVTSLRSYIFSMCALRLSGSSWQHIVRMCVYTVYVHTPGAPRRQQCLA